MLLSDNRKFGPKSADHPSIGMKCPYCDLSFEVGDYTTLVATVPADEEEAQKAREERPYNSCAEEVHWTCFHLMSKLNHAIQS
jgi:hypothetical protein